MGQERIRHFAAHLCVGCLLATATAAAAEIPATLPTPAVRQEVPAPPRAPAGAPNIVLILLDDAGFAAASTFGGQARTPTLSRLADEGLRYTTFNVTAICSPTRAALLSGRNQHRVGFGSTPEAFDKFIRAESARFARLVKEANLKVE